MPPLTREAVADRLRAVVPTLGGTIATEVRASIPSSVGGDPWYMAGLQVAVEANLDFCIGVIEVGEQAGFPLPGPAIGHARREARFGLGLETTIQQLALVERAVTAAVVRQAGNSPARSVDLVLAPLAPALDHLIETASDAHRAERERCREGRDDRRVQVIERLLRDGRAEVTDEAALNYSLRGWHLGLSALGPRVEDQVIELAKSLGRRLLLYRYEDEVLLGWLECGARRIDFEEVRRRVESQPAEEIVVVVGEPGEGVIGWRRTHEQAKLALLPGARRPPGLTRAADVLPEALLSTNRAQARLLISTYLSDLDDLRAAGEAHRETLRVHFAHGRNITATAAALDAARGTVENRLREVEQAIGRPLSDEHMTRLELGLRMENELDSPLSDNLAA